MTWLRYFASVLRVSETVDLMPTYDASQLARTSLKVRAFSDGYHLALFLRRN